MPIKPYGVLTAELVDRRRENTTDTPHFQLHLRADDGVDYRAAINVMSSQSPPELLYVAIDDFRHPVTAAVTGLGSGWHELPSTAGGAALDYVRGNLFDASTVRTIPSNVTGPDNDLADLLEHYAQRSLAAGDATWSVFGQAGTSPPLRTRSSTSCPATASTTAT